MKFYIEFIFVFYHDCRCFFEVFELFACFIAWFIEQKQTAPGISRFSNFRAISAPDFQNPNHQTTEDAESDTHLHRPKAYIDFQGDFPRFTADLHKLT